MYNPRSGNCIDLYSFPNNGQICMVDFSSLQGLKDPTGASGASSRTSGLRMEFCFLSTTLRYVRHARQEPAMANGAALRQSRSLKGSSSSALLKLHRLIEHSKTNLVI